MTVIRALELARQNGYVGPDDPLCFLEPTFFQSLGKAMGWHTKMNCKGACDPYEGTVCGEVNVNDWNGRWHRFIDYLIQGKTAEEYFKSLN